MSFFRRADSDSSDSSSESEEELLSDVEKEDAKAAAAASAGGAAPAKKSRFQASSGSSDSDSDSDSDEESDDDNDADKAAGEEGGAAPKKSSRFAKGGDSDSSSEESEDEGKRIVKSAKSKRAEELEGAAKKIENAAKIDDWVTVNGEFDKMTKLATSNPGSLLSTVTLPPTYLKLLTSIDDSIAESSSKKKKINATHNRALNGMKQKVKKLQREHESSIQKYQTDPEGYVRELEGPAQPSAPVKKPKKSPMTADAPAEEEDDDFKTVGKGGRALALTPETVLKTLQTVLEARGKKSTDRTEQLRVLEKLLDIAATPYAKIRVLLALISSLFDYNTATLNYLPLEQWAGARARFEELLDLLTTETKYVVREEVPEYDEQEERAPTNEEPVVFIRGSLLSLIERLDDEFTRSLKDIDPHAIEYVDRLKDESKVYLSLARACSYCEKAEAHESLNRLVMRRLEHVYNKPDAVISFLESSLPPLSSQIWSSPPPTDPGKGNLVRALCVHLYKPQVGQRLRTRAILCQVFHFAMHNEFFRARDLLLMSHVHQDASSLEIEAMILYNRAVAQLGLSAFRNGLIEETEGVLRDLYSNPALVREKLAQGTQRRGPDYAASAEQERLEKSRQLPFHQHINLELLECAYLVSSMLIEVPQMALEEYDAERKRDVKSRMFRRQLDSWDRQIFAGPPENKREHIVQASKALQSGDWQKCIELIDSIKVWSLLPGEKGVKALLAKRIQEEALRTYLYTHAGFYATISLDYLSTTFELPLARVTAIVSSMIWNEAIAASLDRQSALLVLHRENRSALQQMALVLADRIGAAVNENDRTASIKFGDAETGRGDNRGDRQQAQDGSGQRRGERRGGNHRGRGGGMHSRGRNAANFGQTMGRALKTQ